MRGSLDARSEALFHLSELATALLRDASHNPTADTIHRITITLEAVSAYATPSDGPTPGRLTQDVDPPGFASFASLIAGTGTTKRSDQLTGVTPSQESSSAAKKTAQRASPAGEVQKVREAEETRRARIAAAKVTLQKAKRSLTEARSRAQRLEAAQKKSDAEAKKADAEAKKADAEATQAEKQLRDAEERFKKASTASQDSAHRAQRIAAETEEAEQAVEDARRAIEKASKEVELTSRARFRS